MGTKKSLRSQYDRLQHHFHQKWQCSILKMADSGVLDESSMFCVVFSFYAVAILGLEKTKYFPFCSLLLFSWS